MALQPLFATSLGASLLAWVTLPLLAHLDAGPSVGYDPLALPVVQTAAPMDFTVLDERRQRAIPVRVFLPASETPAPVILFSHGLGGSRENNAYLGRHWSGRGYAIVFLQHSGSDSAVWETTPRSQRLGAMRRAASARNFKLRVRDVPAVIDQLDSWNTTEGHPLSGRLDMKRLGMSGHSFGAVTTQAVSGQTYLGGTVSYTDKRITAALAFSPSSPRSGSTASALGGVSIPWMLMTGTRDDSPLNNTTVESRLAVFPALPTGKKYELVLFDARHSAFSERSLPGERAIRNPNHHRAILALSTAFWDAHLRDNREAETWLAGDGPRRILDDEDRWQSK